MSSGRYRGFQSFVDAGRGIRTVFRTEWNFRIHFGIFALILAAGFGFGISFGEWLAIVLSANADPAAISRPLVRILSDAQGNRLSDALHCDLTERDDRAQYLRTIIRTEDPERHGIRIADYFA